MPSISPSELPKILTDTGYEVVADTYRPKDLYYPMIGKVTPIASATDAPYGHKAVGMVGVGTPTRRKDGEQVSSQRMGEGYPWQIAIHEYSDEISIPDSMLEAQNARQRVVSMTELFTRSYAGNAGIDKDRIVLGMLQKGTLSAGSREFFDQSYTANPDANAGFIYDGKPWFAASGNAHPLKGATNGSGQGVNLTPSLALSSTNLDTLLTSMTVTNAIDERGKPIRIQPRYLLVPRQLRTTALQILNSELNPGTGNNDVNAMRGMLEPLVCDHLQDDSDAWWVLADGSGLMIFDSGPPALTTYRDDSRKCTILQASYRFGAGVHDWRYAACANKAAS